MVKTEGRKSPFMLIGDNEVLYPADSEDLDQPMNLLFRVFIVSISLRITGYIQQHQQDQKTSSNRKVSLLGSGFIQASLSEIKGLFKDFSRLSYSFQRLKVYEKS